jgi:streptogramin lyase
MFSVRFVSRLFRANRRRRRQPDYYKPALLALESRLVPSGFNEFPVPGAPEGLYYDQLANQAVGSSITTGPDGNLWFTHVADHAVAQITPDGTVTEFPLPRDTIGLFSITTGPDGNLWGAYGNVIERVTLDGTVTAFRLPTQTHDHFGDVALNLTAGPDGNVWFTEPAANQIGSITPDGQITEYQVPTPDSQPAGITAG